MDQIWEDEVDVAEVAALCLTELHHDSKTYVLTGPEALSFYDIAEHLSKQSHQLIFVPRGE